MRQGLAERARQAGKRAACARRSRHGAAKRDVAWAMYLLVAVVVVAGVFLFWPKKTGPRPLVGATGHASKVAVPTKGGKSGPNNAAPVSPTVKPSAAKILWQDDFSSFRTPVIGAQQERRSMLPAWSVRSKGISVKPRPDGGVDIYDNSGHGYSAISAQRKYNPGFRYFQVKYNGSPKVGKGYRFFLLKFADINGKAVRGAINTTRAGIYTIDTFNVLPNSGSLAAGQCEISITVHGSRINEQGDLNAGPVHGVEWVRLASEPLDGIAVTRADGSALGRAIKQGDELKLWVVLRERAADVTVEVLTGSAYNLLYVNDRPYVQLRKVPRAGGRQWRATIVIGKGTGKYSPGYPVVFMAYIAGGRIRRTYASLYVVFE